MAVAMHVVAGTPTTGLWCPKCLLPSVIEVPLGFLTLNGYTSMAPHVVCLDCDSRFCGRCRGLLDPRYPTLVGHCTGCQGR